MEQHRYLDPPLMLVEGDARSGHLHNVAEKLCLALNVNIFKIIVVSLFEFHSD